MKLNARLRSRAASLRRGFTLVEILVGLLVTAALAGGVVFTVREVNRNATDTKKVENAKKMTELAVAAWQAGVSVDWADATAAIAALRTGVTIPAPIEGGAPMVIRLENVPNAPAYLYTGPDATRPPLFTPQLNQPNVRP